MTLKSKFAAILSGVVVVMLAAGAAMGADPEFGLSNMKGKIEGVAKDQVAKVDKALPAEAPAKPAKARKLIVFVNVPGGEYYHGSIPVAAYALKAMGAKTGAYEATITDDEKIFSAENLAKFDGIFMLSTTGQHPLPTAFPGDKIKQARQDFSDYIKSGKGGLMGTHAGGDANHQWPEYQDMIGGEFQGHPFFQTGIKNEDPDNPINATFDGKGFGWDDETYVFKMTDAKHPEGYGRDKQHVLLSYSGENTKQWLDSKPPLKDKPPRSDNDYAVSWTKMYGEGRVFYCSLGHNDRDWWNPILLKHYLAGIQFSLGDLKSDTTPSAKLPADRKMGEAPKWDDKSRQIFDVK